MQERTKNLKSTERVTLCLLNVILCVCVFYITYRASLSAIAIDYGVHEASAQEINEKGILSLLQHNQYPMWHILTALLQKSTDISYIQAGAISSGIFNSLTYLATYYYMKMETHLSTLVSPLLAFTAIVIGPFGYSQLVMYWSPNTWHNPTAIAVRPFAVISFILVCDLLNKFRCGNDIRISESIILSIILAVSNLAKPSFAQIIIPGFGLWLLFKAIRNKDCKTRIFFGKMLLIFLPMILLTIAQFTWSFLPSFFWCRNRR